jgi:hypothetical protein
MTVSGFSRRAAAALFVTAALGKSAVLAHHGWSGYLDEEFTLTGVVEAVDLGNPHGRLDVRANGGVWNVVLGPPFRNERAGISDGVIKVGDTVTAHGHRHRDPNQLEMKTERLEIGDQVYDIYPGR